MPEKNKIKVANPSVLVVFLFDWVSVGGSKCKPEKRVRDRFCVCGTEFDPCGVWIWAEREAEVSRYPVRRGHGSPSTLTLAKKCLKGKINKPINQLIN